MEKVTRAKLRGIDALRSNHKVPFQTKSIELPFGYKATIEESAQVEDGICVHVFYCE